MKTISKGPLSCYSNLEAHKYHKASLLPRLSTCLGLPLIARNTQLTALEPWLDSDPELDAPMLKSVGVLSMLRLVVGTRHLRDLYRALFSASRHSDPLVSAVE